MTPDRLVEFIPSTLAKLHPHKMPCSSADAIAICKWFESTVRENSDLSFAPQFEPVGSRFPADIWPTLPTINANTYSIVTAQRPPQIFTPASVPVNFCNYPGYNRAGDLLPELPRCQQVAGHVIASNGELAFSRTDFELSGPFFFRWQRFYRQSLLKDEDEYADCGLGPGWRHSLSESLQLPDPQGGVEKKVLLHTAEGRVIVFDLPAIGHGCFNRCERLFLLRQSLHSFRLISFDQPDKVFRADGTGVSVPLSEMRDTSGNTLSVDYRDGKPVKVVTSWGRTLELDYQEGKLVRINHSQGDASHLCEYGFDASGRLNDCRNSQQQERYGFYDDGMMASITSLTLGHILLNYDSLQRVDHIRVLEDPTPAGQSCPEVQGQASAPSMYYRLRWKTGTYNGRLNCTLSTPDQHDLHWQFDKRGDLLEIRQGTRTSTRRYDHYRNLCRHVDQQGVETLFRHDTFGRLLRRTCGDLTHRYIYDENGRLIAAGSIFENPNQSSGNSTDTPCNVQHWHYRYQNGNSYPKEVVDPAGHCWQCEHDDRGQLRRLTDPEGGVLCLDWDAHGQLVRLSRGDDVYSWEYDTAGRITACKGSEIAPRSWQYHSDGKLSEASVAQHSYLLSRDEYGRLCGIHANDEPLLQWQYDGYSRVRHLQDCAGNRQSLNYTLRGHLTSLQIECSTHSPIYYSWHYNGHGQLTAFGTGKDTQREWLYDQCGRLSEFHDSDSHWYLHYNDQGQLAQIRNNSGQLCSFHFDTLGQLVQAANEHCTLRYRYDARGLLVAEHQDLNSEAGDGNQGSVGDNSLSVNHSHDKRGWLKRSASDQLNIAYTFSAAGSLYGIDANGSMVLRIDAQRSGDLLTGKIISLGNHQLQHSYQNGILVSIHRNEAPLWKRTKSATGFTAALIAAPAATEGQWDSRGNLISEQRAADNGIARYQYQYDGWGLLQCVECGDFKTWLRYDPFGRRLSKSSIHRRSRRQRRVASHWCATGLWNESHQVGPLVRATHYLHDPTEGIAVARLSLDSEASPSSQCGISPDQGQREFFLSEQHGHLIALLGENTAAATADPVLWTFDGQSSEWCPGSYQGHRGIFDVETRLIYRNGHYFHVTAMELPDEPPLPPLDVGYQHPPYLRRTNNDIACSDRAHPVASERTTE
ncbi:DUF6531 domain-containing protein [Microbulbifer sp. HZ11]|uniref:DUF6531 domain-containing protein n=1 Tax=Microbulbifer sp. HZ11 TaxID=1453501 RepID=UPI0005BB1904|nr:DUF6531 domain-containing protein [Microbulbifer sp. HZ11]